ncbi:MAG: histidine kinase [Deltaproteobacteria bacterium]|jgi:quercetin dioxygenase-like cupin family protein|nr:histidine kinase [Deltaproteobacteria bacterium]
MSWGYIDWMYTHTEGVPGKSMNIGLCTILPGQSQHEHMHYGVEQFIYTLKGKSLHIVNGREYVLTPGKHLYMEAGITHNTINCTNKLSVELLISAPVTFQEPNHENREDSGAWYQGNISAAIEAIGSVLMESFRAPFTIFDAQKQIIFQNDYFSQYCHDNCTPTSNPVECACLGKQTKMKHEKDHIWFICPHGHVVYHLPILYRFKEIGAIRGGHIVVSEINGQYGPIGVYDTPQSTAIGIQKMLKQVIQSIQAFCAFDMARDELRLKNKTLLEIENRKLTLEKSLRMSEDNVTNLRINRHFLFNTLNCIADMALHKKGDSLYTAIIQLSSMFRYIMPIDRSSVKLAQEIGYVENYLALQKLRYGDNLAVSKSFDDKVMGMTVPPNFLQPIVENSFTHGFRDYAGIMRIFLETSMTGNRGVIWVKNNGKRLDEASLLRVRKGLSSNSGHALSLIYTKLKSFYGEDFDMNITSEFSQDDGPMTMVTLDVPINHSGEAL